MTNRTGDYNAEQIRVLEGLEAVRLRPGMYVGSTGNDGLHHLVKEILDNSVDEALAGHCDHIDIPIAEDGTVAIRDNGRGIPVDPHPETGLSGLETVMTILHAGGKFDGAAYKVSGGLHGVGASVVNALSEQLTAEVRRDGRVHVQQFSKGIPQGPIKRGGRTRETGSTISWRVDRDIFKDVHYNFDRLVATIRQTAYLNKNLELRLESPYHATERNGDVERCFLFDTGIVAMVNNMCQRRTSILREPFYVERQTEHGDIEISFTYHHTEGSADNSTPIERTFANCIGTPEGGMHQTGFRAALTRALNEYATRNNLFKNDKERFEGPDTLGGLVMVLSVKLADPQFEGQTKNKLGNPEIRQAMDNVAYASLRYWLDENPDSARAIMNKCLTNKAAREAARKARDLVMRKSALGANSLPGKLADCQETDASKSELFIVEGESAGGSAKMGRDRAFQAILPLKGKILNVERLTDKPERILDSKEIQALVAAIGSHDSADFELEKMRYHRVIIMTDADVDGSHIRTLLLTYFFRRMPDAITSGRLYIAQPPLYLVSRGRQRAYAYEESEKDVLIDKMSTARSTASLQRYKGLGEMNPEQLWETTMNPESRRMQRVTMDDMAETGNTFDILMGEAVAPRRRFITTNALAVANLDI